MQRKVKLLLVIAIALLMVTGCLENGRNGSEQQQKKAALELQSATLGEGEQTEVFKKIDANGTRVAVKRYDNMGNLKMIMVSNDEEMHFYDENEKLMGKINMQEMKQEMNKTVPLKMMEMFDNISGQNTLSEKSGISLRMSLKEISGLANKYNVVLKSDENSRLHLLEEKSGNHKMSILYDAIDEEIQVMELIEKTDENEYQAYSIFMEYEEIKGEKVLKDRVMILETRETEEYEEIDFEKELIENIKEMYGENENTNVEFVEQDSEEEMELYYGDQEVEIIAEEGTFEFGNPQIIIEEEYKDIRVNEGINERVFKLLGGKN